MAKQIPFEKKPARSTTPFTEFSAYENGRKRRLKFNVNALADFEQETGMGFAQLMKQRAMFASARAMLWAGLKHEDRGLTIDRVGELLSDYLTDDSEGVEPGSHNIDAILMVAIQAAIDQRALGVQKEPDPEPNEDGDEKPGLPEGTGPYVLEGQVIRADLGPTNSPTTTPANPSTE
jgi:hypothetical protein